MPVVGDNQQGIAFDQFQSAAISPHYGDCRIHDTLEQRFEFSRLH